MFVLTGCFLFWKEWSQMAQAPQPCSQLSKALSLPWILAEKEKLLALILPCSYQWCSSQPAALHRDSKNRFRAQAHSSFSAVADFLGSLCRAWQCPPSPCPLPTWAEQPVPFPDDSPGSSWRKLCLTQLPQSSPWTPERSFSTSSTACACRTCATGGGGAFCASEHEMPLMQRLHLEWRVAVSHTECLWLHMHLCGNPLVYVLGKSFVSRIPHFLILNVMKYLNARFFHAWFHNILPVTIPI